MVEYIIEFWSREKVERGVHHVEPFEQVELGASRCVANTDCAFFNKLTLVTTATSRRFK